MKKRSIAVAGVLSAIAAANLAPAFATPAAVSDVKLAWADAAHSAVKITWTSPLADTVVLTAAFGPQTLGSTAAGAPNELTVPVAKFGATYDPAVISQITVTDSAGAKATSVKFDSYVPRGVPSSVTFGAANAVQGTTKVEQEADLTPGDPLDVSVPLRFTPRLKTDCGDTLFATSTSPSFKLPSPGAPSSLWINTANEWGVPEFDAGYLGYGITTSALKTSAPTTSPYGQVFTISGYVLRNHQYYAPWNGDCGVEQTEPTGGIVVVQARKDSASAWGVVGTTKADAMGRFSYQVTNPGTRQYRVVVPNYAGANRLEYGVAGGVRTIVATTRVLSAKFLSTSVVYGKPATAYLAVVPGGSQRALLQAKSTTGVWSGVTYKTLSAGKGAVAITWKRRGLTAFRWYSPAVKTGSGLTVGAAFSSPFYLTVR
ncbi:hypothetical protein OG394_38600 [Kribbella sp. NBC_01245]|uniref:hypothetical protein n=1 Tax=Kribbella sp. NBC_01245 TaxID=2903578 RepID=UPI002E286612|nr:hypothetical protein [Kribbella sp. NBC_01245]